MSDADRQANDAYRFADLSLDVGQFRVLRGKDNIELPKRSFDLLLALLRASPNSLSIDELMDKVWNGAVVSPATVSKRVELLRQALGDDSNDPRYVALVRGHGYRLIPDVHRDAPRTTSKQNKFVAAIAAVVVAIAAAWLLAVFNDPPPDKSVAVLPFVSMSSDAEDEIFADGLTEELSHALARTGELKVAGRTSSFFYKGHNEDLRVIGETLGVAHLLEGSVRRSRDKLRVTAQLINAEDGFHLWSESYDREMSDILDIQEDIAMSVAQRLRSSLVGAAPGSDSAMRPIGPEAYAIYLKAISLSPYGIGFGLGEAQRLIEQVTELAPGFAPGWNRLAAIHGRRLLFGDPGYEHAPPDAMRIINEAVERALAIDPDSGEAYANLAGIAWVFERDAAKAASLIARALELDPWNLDIVSFGADFAKYIGRVEDALMLEELLIERDPLCETCRLRLSKSYLFTGQYDKAEQELVTLQTMGGGLHWSLGVVLLMKELPDQALQSFELVEDLEHLRLQGRAMALHDLGRQLESEAALLELEQKWGDDNPLDTAQAFAYVARLDQAFQWLEKSLPTQMIDLQTTFPNPLYNPVRNDPRWPALMEQIGRAPAQTEKIAFDLTAARRRLSQ